MQISVKSICSRMIELRFRVRALEIPLYLKEMLLHAI